MPTPLSFRWHDEFVAELDRRRGSVPRSAYVRESLELRWGRDASPAPTSSPDADVLRAASAPTDDGPVFAKYVKNAAGRQVPVSTAGEIIKAELLEAAKRKAQS